MFISGVLFCIKHKIVPPANYIIVLKDIFFMRRSSNKPDVVTANLIRSNIIVDSILLGNTKNNILCGISNATGKV